MKIKREYICKGCNTKHIFNEEVGSRPMNSVLCPECRCDIIEYISLEREFVKPASYRSYIERSR